MPKLTVSGTEYEVQPLSIDTLVNGGGMDLIKSADAIVNEAPEGKLDLYALIIERGKLVLLALQQDNPNIDPGAVYKVLNTKNTSALWFDILGISGMGQSDVGEPKAPVAEEQPLV